MLNSKRISVVMAVLLLCTALLGIALPVFADAAPSEETEAPAEETTAAEETTVAEETTAASTTAKPVSDVSNIIGIIVAVIIGAGAIVAIIVLAPKNNAPKKK